MTQQHIEEFLKYASPRLDYIGHCMEKQALSPAKALQAVKAFRARASTGAIDPSRYKSLGALSESVGKLKGKEKNQLNRVAEKLHKKYYDGKYIKGDYSRVEQRAAAPSFDEVYFARYGRLPDQSMINASVVPPKAKQTADKVNAAKTSAPDTKDTANWLKTHPYLTAAGTAAGGSALGTGLGYALGHSSGSEEAAKKLHTYYAINEALRSNALRRANSDILARLANIFGVGELNNLIGG